MSVPRLGAGVAACCGALYVAGGYDGQNRWNTAERYQPDTNTWHQLAPMNTIRSGLGECMSVTSYLGVQVLVSFHCHFVLDVELSSVSAGLVSMNSYLYAIGGYDGRSQLCSVERYNISRNLWEPRAAMQNCRSAHGATVYQGRIYIFGQ